MTNDFSKVMYCYSALPFSLSILCEHNDLA